ncbi:RING finger protein 150-like [Elysia marginata]|uniref:RING finger protein 150-like n=1 Tax=Elysia marginata TaxID=1093978 RepID=A0AAV4J0A6_9GAST|nr:RING finger protein 150-like [Elysia marginata]
MLYYEADIKYTYKKGHDFATSSCQGKYGLGHQPVNSNVSGKIVHVISVSKKDRTKTDHLGCDKYVMKLPSVKWIALVERGACGFTDKIRTATVYHNASAIVIYDNETHQDNFMLHEDVNKKVAVIISKEKGLELARLLDSGFKVDINIHRGQRFLRTEGGSKNNSSVLFLSVSFSIVVIIAVSWLMYYYIRKFRYSHAKERLAKRLARAAKRAIAKIPQRTLNAGDKELEKDFDQCAICIEPYKDGDIVRVMPCRHIFHKSCVDPWLMDHRTCPMCKLDILQAFGMSMGKLDMLAYGMQDSQEFEHRNVEMSAVMLESIPSIDGRESTTVDVDDHEASSSMEGEVQETSQVKVVLVPHSCLHYHHHGEEALEEDEEEDVDLEASIGLLDGHSAYSTAEVSGSTGTGSSASSKKNHHGLVMAQNPMATFKTDDKSSVGIGTFVHSFEKEGKEPDGLVKQEKGGEIFQPSISGAGVGRKKYKTKQKKSGVDLVPRQTDKEQGSESTLSIATGSSNNVRYSETSLETSNDL